MLLVVWGLPRSGTTFLFNAVRDLFSLSGVEFESAHGNPGKAQALFSSGKSLRVFKTHNRKHLDALATAVEGNHARVLVASREAVGRLISSQRVKGTSADEIVVKPDALLNEAKAWRKLTTIFADLRPFFALDEELMRSNPRTAVWRLAKWLGIPRSHFVASSVAEGLSRKSVKSLISVEASKRSWEGVFSEYDRTTHWHANHIAPDSFRPVLGDEVGFREAAILAEKARRELFQLASRAAWANVSPSPVSDAELKYLGGIEE